MLLEPGSLWQHRKHDPERGEFHQYRLILTTQPSRNRNDSGSPKGETQRILHAKCCNTLRNLWVHCGRSGHFVLNPQSKEWLTEPMVLYRSLTADELPWARPMNEFLDGRFISIQPSQVDEPTIAIELLEQL